MSLTNKIYQFLWHQKWLKPERSRFIYKRLSNNATPPDYPFRQDFFGLQYHGNLNNSIEFNIYHYGAFEKSLLFFMRDVVSRIGGPDSIFLDVGANIGQHSLFMSLFCQKVHAFEPFDEVSKKLESHISLNKITNISLHKVGLSDTGEQKEFFAPSGNNQGIGSFDPATVSKGNKAIGKLSLIVADEYLPTNNINRIDLIKLDVEGFEKLALKGMYDTLVKTRPILVFEISYAGRLSFESLDEIHGALPADYKLYCFDTRKPNGAKARRRGAKARHSGMYQLKPFTFEHPKGQDDIVACPIELIAKLPMTNVS